MQFTSIDGGVAVNESNLFYYYFWNWRAHISACPLVWNETWLLLFLPALFSSSSTELFRCRRLQRCGFILNKVLFIGSFELIGCLEWGFMLLLFFSLSRGVTLLWQLLIFSFFYSARVRAQVTWLRKYDICLRRPSDGFWRKVRIGTVVPQVNVSNFICSISITIDFNQEVKNCLFGCKFWLFV